MPPLKPGDRITLLKKLAKKLAELDWQEIDLTLRQFGFPWSATWGGDPDNRYGYAREHLERGSDDNLIGLNDYLFSGQEVVGGSSSEREGHWEAGLFRLFLSHVHTDKQFVSAVKVALKGYAMDGFVAHEDIDPTKEWISEIELALDTCHALAVFLTPDFHASKWTDQEIGYCLKRRLVIVPVKLGVDPYGFIARYQALAGGSKTAGEIAAEIFAALIGHELTAAPMASAVVSYFEISHSFDETRRRIGLVEQVRAWTPQLLQRLEASIDTNIDIKDCWGMPDRIRSLVKRHTQP